MKNPKCIIVLVIVAIVFFVAWMEYKAYQIANAFKTAFSWFSNSLNSDNSRVETEKKEPEKVYKTFKKWDFWEFVDKKDASKIIKLKVNDIVWKKEYWDDFSTKTAKDNFLFIRIEAENIWKKPNSLSFYNIKLITKDWFEYSIDSSEQLYKAKEWYSWCIECNMNPTWKAEQDLVFDIKKIDLAWAKIRFEDDLIDFEL